MELRRLLEAERDEIRRISAVREDRVLLGDILDAMDQVERYATQGRKAFLSDELKRVWIIHHLQLTSDLSNRISQMTLRVCDCGPSSSSPWRRCSFSASA